MSHSKQCNNKAARIIVSCFNHEPGHWGFFFFFLPEAMAILSCWRKWCGHMRPCGIDPDSKVGQVLTQGQRPALMTIDNNLSLLDFQPNSLLERGNHCLKTAGHKWSGRHKGLIKTPSTRLKNPFERGCQSAVYLCNDLSRDPSSCWA